MDLGVYFCCLQAASCESINKHTLGVQSCEKIEPQKIFLVIALMKIIKTLHNPLVA